MTEWKQKRFWKSATAEAAEGGWRIALDGRGVKTPAKTPLIVPSQTLAARIAAEWDAQDEVVAPLSMPFTRSANAALDKVVPQHAEVAAMLADYGDSDLLCYRADGPDGLVHRQQNTWDPLLDWAADVLGARLSPRAGVMHAPQDPAALATLKAQTEALDAFELTAFHDLVSLSGSLIIGFAALHGAQDANALWQASRLDELWQIEQWGEDEEAEEVAMRKKADFDHALTFLAAHRAG
ncbi:MAG: ATP12 family protein [Pseudomonadota bacterium]